MHAFAIEKVPAQASTIRSPGLVNLCTMCYIHAVFISFGRINGLYQDSSPPFVDALFLRKLENAGYQICVSRVRRAHLSTSRIVDVINRIREQ